MLIRDKQIAELEAARQASFEAQACDYVRREWAGAIPEADLRSTVHALTEDAFGFGIVNQDDVIRFLDIRIYLGDKWASPEFTWVHDYLGEWSSPPLRIDNVIERLRFGREGVE